ncbi:MAG TPA: hypothetical protein PLZ36_17755, partial [Armatimonadota bacterium]|nr:hypothetical protein [Armatimonadota bacterium]
MFLLFGMGPTRRKLLFQYPDTLRDALTGEAVCHWRTRATRLDAAACTVTMETPNGDVRLSEDTHGVWLEASGDRRALTTGAPVALPTFAESPHAAVLRILHAEVLVNLMPFGPVPNLWAYPRPWYRDAAMVLMCLRHTGNLHLVEPWVHGLRSPYDFNNGGIPEADNLGQVLYMLALVDARHHPLVEKIFQEIPRFLDGKHLRGLSDYAEHPVYQTKWLKYGLQHLGLDDPYRIPAEYDSYSALFWMD